MPEFSVGGGDTPPERTTGDRLRTVWDWFITPDDTGNIVPPSAVESVTEEVTDTLAGRSGNNAAETKAEKKALEKLIRGGPLGEAFLDTLFGDNPAGAPDPSGRFSPPFIDEDGLKKQFNEKGEKVLVQMLPMWLADP